jgi:hypothetical protein
MSAFCGAACLLSRFLRAVWDFGFRLRYARLPRARVRGYHTGYVRRGKAILWTTSTLTAHDKPTQERRRRLCRGSLSCIRLAEHSCLLACCDLESGAQLPQRNSPIPRCCFLHSLLAGPTNLPQLSGSGSFAAEAFVASRPQALATQLHITLAVWHTGTAL